MTAAPIPRLHPVPEHYDPAELERLAGTQRAGAVDRDADLPPEVVLQHAIDLVPTPVRWIWDGWLAAGKLHILAGAPGTGKTTIALDLAARLTRGAVWPDGTVAQARDVVVWSGEDDPADTLLPRMLAADADPDGVHFITGVMEQGARRAFDPSIDILHLAAALDQMMRNTGRAPGLLIVDPVVSAVAGDSHKNAEVRGALAPLVDIGQQFDCVVLGISHFTKGSGGRDPVERVTGSLGFGALARVVMAAAKVSDDEGGGRMFARAKSNLGPDGGGFGYDFEPAEPRPGIIATRIHWGDPLDGSARELLARAETTSDPDERSALEDAKEFLRVMLQSGPIASKAVRSEAKDAGHTEPTLRRAKQALGIRAIKRDFGGHWMWLLPKAGEGDHEDDHEGAQGKNMSAFEANEHLRQNQGLTNPQNDEDAHPQRRRSSDRPEHLCPITPDDRAIVERYLDGINEHDPDTRDEIIKRALADASTLETIRAEVDHRQDGGAN